MTVIINYFLFVSLVLGMHAYPATSQSIVDTLPGYPGTLPFKLETGYIGVGDNEEVQLFYYFVQSENDPTTDPLILWIPGGPGCSGLSTLLYEFGPLAFDVANFDGYSLPSLTLNPYSWTKVASVIFLDTPIGSGFSYSNTSQGYAINDSIAALHDYTFLRKWFSIHPTFLKNRLYIAGDSFGGKMTPLVALEIAKGNEVGLLLPKIPLKGYIIGNPGTQLAESANAKVHYAHRMGLISDQQFQLAQSSCNGEYMNPDPNNFQCLYALQLIKECTDPVNLAHILEPKCTCTTSAKPSDSRLLLDDPVDILSLPYAKQFSCREESYVTSSIWANDESVRESLHIRKEPQIDWTRCNTLLGYHKDIVDVMEWHQLLADRGIHGLVYSGDHDMAAPYVGTLKWIRQLNVTMIDLWRPWIVDGQVAGYTEKYKHNEVQAYIVFATVKGAGHTAPEYKPKECFAMIERWLSLYPL